MTVCVLLRAIAIRIGQRIEWYTHEMRITNHGEFNKYIKEPVRKGWDYGENLWETSIAPRL